MFLAESDVDQWQRLKLYRQRYQIEHRLAPIHSLEKSIGRRLVRSATLGRRLNELREQIQEVRTELHAVESEIDRSRQTGALLIEEILDQVQVDMGEAWTPRPIRGFRVWRIDDNRVTGNQMHWLAPSMTSQCLREIPGEDLPHSVDRCGPPACGIYAVKDLDMFPPDAARGEARRSIVGVVSMSGKVVEHEGGYRAYSATAVAVVANNGVRRIVSTDPITIDALFDNPGQTLARGRAITDANTNEAREFLESALSKERQWI